MFEGLLHIFVSQGINFALKITRIAARKVV